MSSIMIDRDGYLTTNTRLAPLYWRLWKAATLAWKLWDILPGDADKPFDNISLRTAIAVGWQIHRDAHWVTHV